MKKVMSVFVALMLAFGLVSVAAPKEVQAANGLEWAIEPVFGGARCFSEGLAAVAVGEWPNLLWGFIDTEGNWVIEPQFDEADSFSEGLAGVRTGDGETGLWGFIDTSGTMVIEPQFDGTSSFSSGLAAVRVGDMRTGIWGFIDKDGEVVIEPQFSSALGFSEGLAAVGVGVWPDRLFGFIDTNGNMVIEPRFAFVENFSEGLAAINFGDWQTDPWGFINTSGEIVIEPQFISFNFGQRPFSEGLAVAAVGRDGGFIDATGAMVIEPQFTRAHDFLGGLAAVWGDYFGLIDKTGHMVMTVSGVNSLFSPSYGLARASIGNFSGYGFIAVGDISPTPQPITPTSAATILRFPIDSTTFTVNGTAHTLEAAPFIANDRTMVPLRVIGEALGATNLAFNAGVITFNIGDQAFSMAVGEPLPGGFGTPVIVAERTFVPLAFIVNEMGAAARWDGATRAAYIYIN